MAKKTIIVTGLGLAIAQYLLSHSHNVVVLARSKELLEKIRAEYPKQVITCAGDLADFSLPQKAVDAAVREFGQIDGLVVNHGVLEPVTRLAGSNVEDWKTSFDINVFSALALVKAAIPELRKSKGRTIFISSGAASRAYSGWGCYGASKACLNHLNLTVAAEEPDITSLSIRPGLVDSDMQASVRDTHIFSMSETDAEKFLSAHREGRLLKPYQPGSVIARLALEADKGLSGKYLEWVGIAKFKYKR
ncbi:MAG: hypothetical protein LQ342_002442 [Letrouitia transgressa]|nr:MAG: hypothetical protein LQ342_002442 [Letrouitia transgressa]